jgi:IS30 family transposase
MATKAKPQLSREEREQIERLSDDLGDRGAATELMVHPITIARALACRPLRPSTAQCLRSRLRELTAVQATIQR